MLRRIALAVIVLASFAVAPAAAHTDVIRSTPKDGQTLRQAPAEVAFVFGEDLLAGGNNLVVKDADGNAVEVGPVEVNGNVLSALWTSDATGAFTASYRAVASDGHPLTGRISFSIAAQESPSIAAKESPSPVAAPVAEEPAASEPEAGNPWLLAAPLLLVAAVAVGGFVVWRSRD